MKRIQKLLFSILTLICSSLLADDSATNQAPVRRGLDLENMNISPAYNLPAAINTHKWNYFVDASFIYWHVSEEFLTIGSDNITLPSGKTLNKTLGPKFVYKPGFKVGLGINTPFDDWVLDLNYTRIKEQVTTHYTVTPSLSFGDYSWDRYWPNNGDPQKTEWSFNLNLFDLDIQRPFYQGKKIIVSPLLGLRGVTLKQSYKFYSVGSLNNYKSHLWAIGPRLGVNLNWLLYKEFRLIGTGIGSLLYTKYTLNKLIENSIPTLISPDNMGEVEHYNPEFSALRANLECDLGLGWGMYLSDQKYHIDFKATYDFQVFFKTNVTTLVNTSWIGDIYMHGLTVSGRFDF